MDEIIDKIGELGQRKQIPSPELIIMTTLYELDPYLEGDLENDTLDRIQSNLFGLFSINEGDFSIQCAMFIASKLLKVFTKSKTSKLWEMINLLISQTTDTTIVATGYLCKYIGETSKAQLPRLIEHLLKTGKKYSFSSIYTLREAFRAGSKTVAQFAQPIFDFIIQIMGYSKQKNTLFALKFMHVIIKSGLIANSQIVEACKQYMLKNNDNSPLIQNEIASVIAHCVYYPYSTLNVTAQSKSEWIVGARAESRLFNLSPAFDTFNQFPTIIPQIVRHFLIFLGPELASLNHLQLFSFIRTQSPEEVIDIIPLLPGDVRYTYFRELVKARPSPEQLRILKLLCIDDSCYKEATAIALTLINFPQKEFRNEAVSFISSLTITHPFIIMKYFKPALAAISSKTHELEIFGSTLVIKTILSNIKEKESTIETHKSALEDFIRDAMKNPGTPQFTCAFQLLQVLPKQFALISSVTKAVDVVLKTKQPSKELLKAVFGFRAKFSKVQQNRDLISNFVNYQPKIPLSVLSNLCSMIPKALPNDPLAYTTTLIILQRALKYSPSQPLIKSFFKHPLPISTDLLCTSVKEGKHDSYLDQVIRKFPLLVASCQSKDQTTLITTVLEPQSQCMMTLLIVASMAEAKATKKILPINLHRYLLSLLTAKNSNVHQAVCECLALFTRSHIDVLPELYQYIEAHATAASCLLLNALFAHVSIPQQYIVRSFQFLDAQMKTAANVTLASHAFSSLLLTHSMQLSSMASTIKQFEHLFIVIHQKFSLQPITLKLLSHCFYLMIELFSSDLISPDTPLSKMVILFMRTFELAPIRFAKEIYFDTCRAVYTFGHSLTKYAEFQFPTSKSQLPNLKLTACESFSDYFKFQQKTMEIEKLIPISLSLLQVTSDQRSSHFVIALASQMKEIDLGFWVSTVRRVLVTSSLLEQSPMSIEPTQDVKRTCLDVMMFIVDQLAQQFKLSTEYLDDIITSLCRAVETGSIQLQEAAFPVLQKVIELFKDRITEEGNRLLDLYDSQFAAVVKVGFQLNLLVSGGFLSTYLIFNTDNMTNDPENCSAILIVYLAGLDRCQQRTSSFYYLATHLCTVGRKYPQILQFVQPFLITMTPIFSNIVLQAMQLWKACDDWRAISDFRNLASTFYAELLPSFVWLQTISEKVIDVNVLLSFFIIEMKLAKEPWMVKGAVDALSVAIKFCGKEINGDLIELAIRTMLLYKQYDERELLIHSAALLQGSSNWDSLRYSLLSLAMSTHFTPQIFAYLLHSDENHKLAQYSLAIAYLFVEKYKNGDINFNSTIALFTLLFNHSPICISQTLEYVIGNKGMSTKFKLALINLGFLTCDGGNAIGSIPRYLISSFKKGGMHTIGQFLLAKPDLGILFLSKGGAKAALLLGLKDMDNTRAYLWFIQLSLSVFKEKKIKIAKAYAPCVFRFLVKIIEKWGVDLFNGRMIIWHCIRILHDIEAILGKEFSACFDELDKCERQKVISLMNEHVEAAIQNKKIQDLMEISNTERSHKTNEWVTLEIEDSD